MSEKPAGRRRKPPASRETAPRVVRGRKTGQPAQTPAAPTQGKARGDPLRRAVVEAYLRWEQGDALPEAAPSALGKEADRRLFLTLLQGMIRHQRLLEAELERLTTQSRTKPDPVVRALTLLGLGQLLLLERIPPHALVYETVELARAMGRPQATGWVNGVLRAALREAPQTEARLAALPLAVRTSHPDWMVTRWQKFYGEARTAAICEANTRFEGLSVRVETRRISPRALLRRLADEGVEATPHRRWADALWVPRAGPLLRAPAFREGLAYVQDVASQVLMAWVAPELRGWVLDACAAPGGKLTLLGGRAGPEIRPLGADRSAEGLDRVRENLRRLRLRALPLLRADGRRLPFGDGALGAVVLDVSCTATATIRKAPEIKWRRTLADVARFAAVQADLLAEAARVVAPGGVVLYATCSLEAEENGEQVAAFLARRNDFSRLHFRDLPQPAGLRGPAAGLLTGQGDFQMLPSDEQMGLYGALLRKSGGGEPVPPFTEPEPAQEAHDVRSTPAERDV